MTIESLPAKELVKRWVKTNDEFEERRLDGEIKRRTNLGDGEPFHEIKVMHRELWTSAPETSPSRESKISSFDYDKMKRIHRKTEKILGREAVDIIRRLDDVSTPKQLLERLDRARRVSGMRKEARLRRAI